jgi:hypothetical protein
MSIQDIQGDINLRGVGNQVNDSQDRTKSNATEEGNLMATSRKKSIAFAMYTTGKTMLYDI